MDDFFRLLPAGALAGLGAVLLAGLLLRWWVVRRKAEQARRRADGHALIAALNAYAAWVDLQRDAPLPPPRPSNASAAPEPLPAPLREALRLKDASFPHLAHPMVQLLLSHSRLMELLWQHALLRISGGGNPPVYRDPAYLALRDRQEELLQILVAACRSQIGETENRWSRTGSDFVLSSHTG